MVGLKSTDLDYSSKETGQTGQTHPNRVADKGVSHELHDQEAGHIPHPQETPACSDWSVSLSRLAASIGGSHRMTSTAGRGEGRGREGGGRGEGRGGRGGGEGRVKTDNFISHSTTYQ